MNFSIKKAFKHVSIGSLLGLIPSVITWAVAKHYTDMPTAILIGAFAQTIFGPIGTNASAFVGMKKANAANQASEGKDGDI